jgi:hypothetical protein
MFTEGLSAASGHDRLLLMGNLAYTELLLGRRREAIDLAKGFAAMNVMFGSHWATDFAEAIQRLAGGQTKPALRTADEIYHATESGTDHAVISSWILALYDEDSAAGVCVAEECLRRHRGQDWLERIRLRLLVGTLKNEVRDGEKLFRRLSALAYHRGAKLVSQEIDDTLAEALV